MPMERVHKPMVLLLAFFIAFSSLTTSSDGRKAHLENHSAKNDEKGAKEEDHTRIPSNVLPYRGANMYFPDPGEGLMEMSKDGQKKVDGQNGALLYSGYPPNFYGYPPVGYGYPFPFPFPGGIFGFPRGIFGFPRGIFGIPGGIFGFPPFGGGYGGFPGGYGGGGPGNIPGGFGGKVEMKGKGVNSHD